MTIIYCFGCYLLSISILVVFKYPVINGSTNAEVLKLTELNCEIVVLSKDGLHNIFFVMCTQLQFTTLNVHVNQTKVLIDVFVNLSSENVNRHRTWTFQGYTFDIHVNKYYE